MNEYHCKAADPPGHGSLAGLIVLIAVVSACPPLAGADRVEPLRVMTYNLRYASDTPPNAWPQRLPVAVAMLSKMKPDLFGTQEALWQQVRDLEEALPAFHWIGLGRDGGSRGEFMAVFFRKERLESLAFDHFWLSDTPDVIGSTSWGNTNRRMVTWVLFRDRKTDRRFYFWNTHFDHQIQQAREKSAALVLKRVAQLPAEVPVVLVGDFNAAHGTSPVYRMLVSRQAFADTWTAAEKKGELLATFHGYKPPQPGGKRIDWILTRGPVQTLRTQIVTYQQDGQYPSDHFPVVADIILSDSIDHDASRNRPFAVRLGQHETDSLHDRHLARSLRGTIGTTASNVATTAPKKNLRVVSTGETNDYECHPTPPP